MQDASREMREYDELKWQTFVSALFLSEPLIKADKN